MRTHFKTTMTNEGGSLGPFDSDVTAEDGSVDVRKLAAAVDLTPAQLATILGVEAKTFTESPINRKIQGPAVKFLNMMNELALHLQEKRYARYWLRSPQREFGDQTALDWLMNGNLDEICHHVGRMVRLQPD